MKKILVFFVLCLFMMPISVKADHMYKVDMKINVLKDGTANITEIWDVKATSGTEWYKAMYELGNSKLSDFVVYMDGRELTYDRTWDINGSLSSKAGYYGINNTSSGMELCFGKSDMKRHTFTLKYTLSNYVFNTSDSQVLYWTLLPKVTVDDFTVELTSYYEFPDSLDVWGYGYKGYAYVENGKIKMSNEGKLDNEYVVLLAKFPLGTFNVVNTVDDYDNFGDVLNQANTGKFDYDYDNDSLFSAFINSIINFISNIFPFIMIIITFISVILIANRNSGYKYNNDKKIDKKNVPMFRDIPCNKDIYYANALIMLNNFDYKESNILGAIMLKWVKTDKIRFRNEKVGIFNKETSVIDLSMNPTFDYDLETKLFNMMYEASKDGILEAKELERWCKRNYSKFLNVFDNIVGDQITSLRDSGYISNVTSSRGILGDKIYDDSVKLYGLKKYLLEFSKIDTKEVMEVKLWDEYLMFAYLFGIADKVAKQLKDLYPEVIEQVDANGNMLFDYDMFLFVNSLSTRSVSAASSAKSAAQAYSAGGGGFSSGGGGGGSFGGGGGGSMGGR